MGGPKGAIGGAVAGAALGCAASMAWTVTIDHIDEQVESKEAKENEEGKDVYGRFGHACLHSGKGSMMLRQPWQRRKSGHPTRLGWRRSHRKS